MQGELRRLLDELYGRGRDHDAHETDPSRRMLNITPETGELLRAIVIAGNLTQVLELGTSNGYSTIWLADACRHVNGRLISVDRERWKLELALENLKRPHLAGWAELRHAEIAAVLGEMGAAPREFDLVFLDCERHQYVDWWPTLQRIVRPGGLLIVDNAISHAAEVQPLIDAVRATDGYSAVVVPIGNGEFVALREPGSDG